MALATALGQRTIEDVSTRPYSAPNGQPRTKPEACHIQYTVYFYVSSSLIHQLTPTCELLPLISLYLIPRIPTFYWYHPSVVLWQTSGAEVCYTRLPPPWPGAVVCGVRKHPLVYFLLHLIIRVPLDFSADGILPPSSACFLLIVEGKCSRDTLLYIYRIPARWQDDVGQSSPGSEALGGVWTSQGHS